MNCDECNGTGVTYYRVGLSLQQYDAECEACNGTGKLFSESDETHKERATAGTESGNLSGGAGAPSEPCPVQSSAGSHQTPCGVAP